MSGRYTNEEVQSRYTYPAEYEGPKPIGEQIQQIAEIFGIDATTALEYAKDLPELPEGAEGWFAIPSVEAVARVHFPDVEDENKQHCHVLQLVLEKIGSQRQFTNWREGSLAPSNPRVHDRTKQALETMVEAQRHNVWLIPTRNAPKPIISTQRCDILVIPAQLGLRHRGRSVRRARECFASNEFGLTSVAVGSILLTHPTRLVKWDELDMDCAGDEFDSPIARVRFDLASLFYFRDRKVGFDTRWFDDASGRYGSVSGFLTQ